MDQDRCTFFVLRRVLGSSCQLVLSDHENLILCYTCEPYPVWIWTPDHAPLALLERAYRLVSEHSLLRKEQRFNLKYELADYMIRRAAEDGIGLTLYKNMFAYTYPEHRRKHYAENLVYQVTCLVKEDGMIPMLYTNADYAAHNACYRKIGYVLRGRLCSVAVR